MANTQKTPAREMIEQQALNNAKAERSLSNYPAIIEGFIEKGIPADEIVPRENVFTYNAWRALNRQVRKGEHGVKVVTWIKGKKQDEQSQESDAFKFPRSVTVFHVTQTEPVEARA